MTDRKKFTIQTLRDNKKNGVKTTWICCYDYPSALICEEVGVDFVLCGDSLSNNFCGLKSTVEVGMQEMLHHTKAVARALDKTMLCGDMPFLSYTTPEDAVKNAGEFIRAGCNVVKLEGNVPEQIMALKENGIVPISHLGLTPQSTDSFGGYRVQGKTNEQITILCGQAGTVESAGAAALLLEAVPQEATNAVLKTVKIPVLGIGAGQCDGQLLLLCDILGVGSFKPKFAKQYVSLKEIVSKAVAEYSEDVKAGRFPYPENIYGS